LGAQHLSQGEVGGVNTTTSRDLKKRVCVLTCTNQKKKGISRGGAHVAQKRPAQKRKEESRNQHAKSVGGKKIGRNYSSILHHYKGRAKKPFYSSQKASLKEGRRGNSPAEKKKKGTKGRVRLARPQEEGSLLSGTLKKGEEGRLIRCGN